jgi:hypothetical protein
MDALPGKWKDLYDDNKCEEASAMLVEACDEDEHLVGCSTAYSKIQDGTGEFE